MYDILWWLASRLSRDGNIFYDKVDGDNGKQHVHHSPFTTSSLFERCQLDECVQVDHNGMNASSNFLYGIEIIISGRDIHHVLLNFIPNGCPHGDISSTDDPE